MVWYALKPNRIKSYISYIYIYIYICIKTIWHYIPHQSWRAFVISSPNVLMYYHVFERVNVSNPVMTPPWGKLTTTWNSALVHSNKFFSRRQFVSCRREKEKDYASWVDRVSWEKRKNMLLGDSECWHKSWILFLIFYCSFSMFSN